MKYPKYNYATGEKLYSFFFESIGEKGIVKKMVQYKEMSTKGYFNLGFGDYNEQTNEIDDQVRTNNGDGQKVLATVIDILMFMFLQQEVARREQDYTGWEFRITYKN